MELIRTCTRDILRIDKEYSNLDSGQYNRTMFHNQSEHGESMALRLMFCKTKMAAITG